MSEIIRKLKTMDGNTAAAHTAYAFTDVAAIYPITPSSTMAEYADEWAANGRKNIFGQEVKVVEMQSEGGAAGAVHGAAITGALATTFTASQGLLLMIPNMYKIAGERLPVVFHVSARTLATHALSIFGDHSDVMSCRQTGFAMLASCSVQESMDLAAVAHLAAIEASAPFMHFFDGFRTSHEMQKIAVWDYETLASLYDTKSLENFRAKANNPNHPVLRGSAQNGDIFFQAREASNTHYESIPAAVEAVMNRVNALIGTDYAPFNYVGAPDAERVIVAMGSVCDTAEEVVAYLNAKGEKTGLVKVRLYRPFCADKLLQVLPKTVKTVAVLDRTKEPGGVGEPLYLDVKTALSGSGIEVVGGRYGLSSKDTTPGQIVAVYKNIAEKTPKNNFTIGINDDVTHLSLEVTEEPDTTPADIVSCKFWGLGSDGTVGANKNSIKIIGDHTDKTAQAYFQYDSRKSGGVTISHLRFGDSTIKSAYYVSKADFVACHSPGYLEKYEIAPDVKPGGALLLNCAWNADELGEILSAQSKKYIYDNKVRVYTVDAVSIAKKLGLGNRTNSVLQSAFFKLSKILPIDDAVRYMKEAVRASYGNKGADVVAMNDAAIDAGLDQIIEIAIPELWKSPAPRPGIVIPTDGASKQRAEFVNNVLTTVNAMKGDSLPVSAFLDTDGGSYLPAGTSAFEKRAINSEAPVWIPENCIQCNQCAYVCPHAVVRPFVLDDNELAGAPAELKSVKMLGKGNEDKKFSICVSALDCTGCGSCVNICPAKTKALAMQPIAEAAAEQKAYNYAFANVSEKETGFAAGTVKGSQFKTPLLEFPGACAGCGETPYAKLVTQLFGDRMYIANATGCSSIWAGSAPSTPYTVNKDGKGPAWSNSLFEDNAEFGLGMRVAVRQRRDKLAERVNAFIKMQESSGHKSPAYDALVKWYEAREDGEASKSAAKVLEQALTDAVTFTAEEKEDFKAHAPEMFDLLWDKELDTCGCPACKAAREILTMKDLFAAPSFWIFGGDGWAYDIGYGGLDHVIASGENVNILVFDTEVYSNTGGQSSKATPIGAVAQFAAAGKSVKKKDLAQIAMSYGYVYVAQVAMGANYQQTLNAIREAEAYNGPSLIIAYAPCINHGVRAGMGKSMAEMKNAVAAGYWNMLRFNPALAAEGKNPLTLDSGDATASYRDFIMGEVRYSSLKLSFPDRAEVLFDKAEEAAKTRYEELVRRKESLEK